MGDGFRPLLGGREARDRPHAPLRSSQVRPAAPERTPRHPAGVPGLPEAVTREAYLHEVSSAGFWPGNQAFLGPPSIPMPIPNWPASESSATPGAHLHATPGEFILPYDRVRTAADPDALLLDFLSTTCAAAAEAGRAARRTTAEKFAGAS